MVLTRSVKTKDARRTDVDGNLRESTSGVTQGAPPPPSSHVEPPAPHTGELEATESSMVRVTQGAPPPPSSHIAPRPTQPAALATPAVTAVDTTYDSGAPSTLLQQPAATASNTRVYKVSSSKRSSRRLECQLQLAKAKEDHIRLIVELAAARIATLEAESHVDDEENARTTLSDEDGMRKIQRIDSWLHEVTPPRQDNFLDIAAAPPLNLPPPSKAPVTVPKSDIAELAAAITLAARQGGPNLSTKYYAELPFYGGSHLEWLSFKVAYNESAANYTATENTARLRRSLKGKARESVENLLLDYTEPAEIMNTLESRFGRPEAIAITELERLRALPKLTDNPREICIFASKVSNIVAALKTLERVHYLYNPIITSATSEKLPPTLRYRWFEFAATQPADEPDLMKLTRFLQREAELCSPYAQPEPEPSARDDHRRQNNQRTYATQAAGERSCVACRQASHSLPDCPEFKAATTDDCWDIAKAAKLCFRCLRLRKRQHHCKTRRCDIDGCSFSHHHLLHHIKREAQKPKEEEICTSTWTKKLPLTAYLKIAPVTVIGPAGEANTWALLDNGSTVSLIEENLAKQIGADGPIDPLYITAIGNKKVDASNSRRVLLTLRGRDSDSQQLKLRTVRDLRLSSQRVPDSVLTSCPHLEILRHNLDTGHVTPKILIGQDNWHLLTTKELRSGRRDQPVASLTPLGWVIHGVHADRQTRVHFVAHMTTEDNMDDALRNYFAVEGLTVAIKTPINDPEQRALRLLKERTIRLPNGRFETPLLWRDQNISMPDNYASALNRLTSIERKLSHDPEMKRRYHEQMTALIDKGYAEVAPPTTTAGKTWYLPHFAVLNPMKPNKLRVVHDAAAKTKGKCLNDFLLTGPDLLQSLPGVLMRFRQHAIAVSADITEMFMQVGVLEEDRDALRYLWREDSARPVTQFRMKSVIFGATSSPATAIYVKNENAERHREQFPEAADAIVRNHYMDDYLGSYRTSEETKRIAAEVRDIHKRAHFNLRKWNSNDENVLKQLSPEAASTDVTLTDKTGDERVLGLVWRTNDDVLGFNLDLVKIPKEVLRSDAPTKRQALRIIMSIYDPLGLIAPVTGKSRQILREIFRRGTAWDTPIDIDLSIQWKTWLSNLERLRNVTIPRCYLGYSDAVTLQLHTFVDASESSYSAALYWRAEGPDGEVRKSLVLGKSRVAPLKLMSIPRLELQAAVMGSRMAMTVIEEHDRKPDSKIFWSDSATVLTWLRTGSRAYRPFVAHRVAAVEENTTLSEWRWIPTKLNIADDATRDVPDNFTAEHRWFRGPDFLSLPEDNWPTARALCAPDHTGEERCSALTKTLTAFDEATPNPERFSKWERYLRTTARVLTSVGARRNEVILNEQGKIHKQTRHGRKIRKL